MNLLKLLPFLLCFSTFAQVNLFIESKTEQSFLVGINDFEQNSKAVKSLIIQKLDTFPFDLRVQLSEEIAFSKKMHFHQKGNYHYIITTNSQNTYQLRYRGELSSLQADVQKMDLQSAISLKALPLATASSAQKVQIQKIDTLKTLTQPTVVVVAPVSIPVKEIKPPIAINNQPETLAISSFDQFMSPYKTLEFEFEKQEEAKNYVLGHSVSVEEMQMILAEMKYDNTKLELFKATKGNLKGLKGVQTLSNSLEYEISKQQFKSIFEL